MFTFTDSELSEIRLVLTRRALDLRLDELSFADRNLPFDSFHNELVVLDSVLSKLSK